MESKAIFAATVSENTEEQIKKLYSKSKVKFVSDNKEKAYKT